MVVARGMKRKISSGSNLGMKIIDAPDSKIRFVATNSPCVWKIGSACSSTSFAVNFHVVSSAWALEARLSCVSIAPFERPVVPDV